MEILNQGMAELKEAEDNLKEDSETLDEGEAKIIRSFPEEKRAEMAELILADKRQNGAYASWIDAVFTWGVLWKTGVVIILIIMVLMYGFPGTAKMVKEFLSEMSAGFR